MSSARHALLACVSVVSVGVPGASFAQTPGDERLLTELTALERASWEAAVRDGTWLDM